MEYIRYANQNATRNQPISNELAQALAFLPELGIQAEVFSGGQPSADQGGGRVGSVRHDHGNAADVFFYQNGRRLDWANPNDQPIFEEIVRRGRQSGLTGFGAGDGYMMPGSMHVGFGTESVWGADGKGANAPEWLRRAYGAAPSPQGSPQRPPQGQVGYPAPPQPQNALSQPQNALTQPPQYQNALAVSDFLRPTAAPMALQGYEQFMRS